MIHTEPNWKSYLVETTEPIFTPEQCDIISKLGRSMPPQNAQVVHFPQRPIMPGVLMVEAMAQVGGLVMLEPGEKGARERRERRARDATRRSGRGPARRMTDEYGLD